MADEAPEPLLERQNRQGHLVVAERIAAPLANGVDSCGGNRVAGRCERQLVDDHAAERFADDIDTLPEARGGEQHGVRRRAELLQQLRARRGTLREDRVVERHFRDRQHRPHARVAREQHERASPRALQDLDHFAPGGEGEVLGARIRHLQRQVQDRLPREIELGRQAHFVRVPDAETIADVVEVPVDGERCRRQHGGMHPVEQQLSNDCRHIDRRGSQKDAAPAELDEVHVFRIADPQQKPQLVAQFAGAPDQRRERLIALFACSRPVVLVRL